MTTEEAPKISAKMWLSAIARMAAFPLVLLWPAGTWRWWEAWVVIGLWIGFAVAEIIFLARHDPALLAERMKSSRAQEGQKSWDKVLMLLFFVAGIGSYLTPGFDVMRFEWSEPFPVWIELLAMAVHIPSFLFIGWVMRENTFLLRVVKIDEARGHKVITTGPYAIVRHPMYTAVIVLIFAFPVALGSRYALIPAAVSTALMILRTALEDRTLHAELAGYPEYAAKTRYRLIPGLW